MQADLILHNAKVWEAVGKKEGKIGQNTGGNLAFFSRKL